MYFVDSAHASLMHTLTKKIFQHFKDTKDINLRYSKTDKDSLKSNYFIDNNHKINEGYIGQLGIFNKHIGKRKTFHSIYWSSSKCQPYNQFIRICKTYTFSNKLDSAIGIKMQFRTMDILMSLYVFTDF